MLCDPLFQAQSLERKSTTIASSVSISSSLDTRDFRNVSRILKALFVGRNVYTKGLDFPPRPLVLTDTRLASARVTPPPRVNFSTKATIFLSSPCRITSSSSDLDVMSASRQSDFTFSGIDCKFKDSVIDVLDFPSRRANCSWVWL